MVDALITPFDKLKKVKITKVTLADSSGKILKIFKMKFTILLSEQGKVREKYKSMSSVSHVYFDYEEM